MDFLQAKNNRKVPVCGLSYLSIVYYILYHVRVVFVLPPRTPLWYC